jgi:hypothetical protein
VAAVEAAPRGGRKTVSLSHNSVIAGVPTDDSRRCGRLCGSPSSSSTDGTGPCGVSGHRLNEAAAEHRTPCHIRELCGTGLRG